MKQKFILFSPWLLKSPVEVSGLGAVMLRYTNIHPKG